MMIFRGGCNRGTISSILGEEIMHRDASIDRGSLFPSLASVWALYSLMTCGTKEAMSSPMQTRILFEAWWAANDWPRLVRPNTPISQSSWLICY